MDLPKAGEMWRHKPTLKTQVIDHVYHYEDGSVSVVMNDFRWPIAMFRHSFERVQANENEAIEQFVIAAKEAFNLLQLNCQYESMGDCAHPDIEFNCMSCCTSNCPLLID